MALAPLPGTAVRWYWHTGEEFTLFDVRVCASLEKQYEEVRKLANASPEQLRLRIDEARYIDINFKTDVEIKRHFRGLDDEAGLIGLQRRYDDPMKRRAVKRDATLFQDIHFVAVGPDPGQRISHLLGVALSASASVGSAFVVSNKTTVVVACASNRGPRDAAVPVGLPIISVEWIAECISLGKLLPADTFVLVPVVEPAAVVKRTTPLLSSDNDTPPVATKKARSEAGALTEVAALHMQLVAGMQLAGLSLSTTSAEEELSIHCSMVFLQATPADAHSLSQSLSGVLSWSCDGTITHRSAFTATVDMTDAKRRVLRVTEEWLVWGQGRLGVYEGRVNRTDCRLFSHDRSRQLALLPVPTDRTAFVGTVSAPVLLQITQSAPPTFQALLVFTLDQGQAHHVSGTLTPEALHIDGASVQGRLRAVGGAEGVFEGTITRERRQMSIRLKVAGS